MEIDDTKNPFDTGAENPGYDETEEINEMDRFPSSSSRRGSEDINNPYHHRTYEETSFTTGGDERTPLLDGEFQEAAKILKSKFPKWNPLDSSFNATLNRRGEVVVTLTDTRKAVPHVIIDADGNVNEREIRKSKKIQNSLGPPAGDIIRTKEEEISRREKKIEELQVSLETASENQREEIYANIEEQENEKARLEAENERIEERMSLRDRVKLIFKKHDIASFVFKTAGEAVGFLAKNAWLLILAAVMFMIEKFKRNKA